MAVMHPVAWRSSGTTPTPAAVICLGVRPVSSVLSTKTRPESGCSKPASTNASSVWPLPSTPAMPTISPGLTLSVMFSSWVLPRLSVNDRSSICSMSRAVTELTTKAFACCTASCGRLKADTSRPTMARTKTSIAVSAMAVLITTRPARMTVQCCATLEISASLCVTSTTAQPLSAIRWMRANKASISPGGKTAVGSSSTTRSG